MNLPPIEALYKYKNSDSCVFLGSGSSINRISKSEWRVLEKYDLWTVNNWVYHPSIVPDFYHVETKFYGYEILQRRMFEKSELYKDTKFIFPKGKLISVNGGSRSLHKVVPNSMHKFEYLLKSRDVKRTHPIFNANYQIHPKILTKSYNMSLTILFELMYKFGYKKIIIFGVDLKDSYYFWTGGDPKYGEVHHQVNKEHEGKDPNQPHNTYRIKDFIIDFNRRWMVPNGREILAGYKGTLLFPGLNYISVRALR